MNFVYKKYFHHSYPIANKKKSDAIDCFVVLIVDDIRHISVHCVAAKISAQNELQPQKAINHKKEKYLNEEHWDRPSAGLAIFAVVVVHLSFEFGEKFADEQCSWRDTSKEQIQ